MPRLKRHKLFLRDEGSPQGQNSGGHDSIAVSETATAFWPGVARIPSIVPTANGVSVVSELQ